MQVIQKILQGGDQARAKNVAGHQCSNNLCSEAEGERSTTTVKVCLSVWSLQQYFGMYIDSHCEGKVLCTGAASEQGAASQQGNCRQPGVASQGAVEGVPVTDIILDTGSARTIIRSDLVPEERKTGGEIPIRCAHGDTIIYPLAQAEIQVGEACLCGRSSCIQNLASLSLIRSRCTRTDETT